MALRDSLIHLAKAHHLPVDAPWLATLEQKIQEEDLDEEPYPKALLDFLDAFAKADTSQANSWQSFDDEGLDTTGAFNLIRSLDDLVPVSVLDEGERYTVQSELLKVEAILALEGYVWMVKPIDLAEPA